MNRREFLKKSVALGAGGFVLSNGSVEVKIKEHRPNIIHIMLDELAYNELSLMGNPYIRTPEIDKMAAEGIRFTQALAGGPTCAPTRGVLMTGQHSGHCTVRENHQKWPLRAEDVTVAEVLKKAGYATGGFGKWGCGDRGTTGVPEKHGFDIFYGYYNQVHAHSYYPCYMIRNSELEYLVGNPGSKGIIGPHYTQYLIYEETINFIRKNMDKPFYCYCAWTPPHGDFIIPPDDPAWRQFKDEPWPSEDAKKYAAMVKMCDTQIGNIFQLLKDLGLDDNTIVFLSGDNGGNRYFNDFFHGNEPFRGKKGNLYEGGLRIPMIVRWPGKIAPGVVSDFLWYFPDMFPTFAELAGADVPDQVDGISILPTLIGPQAAGHPQEIHDYLYWEHKKQIAVRIGNYKGIQPDTDAEWELYDLSVDLPEADNIADANPAIIAKMKAYAAEAHTEHLIGDVLDATKAFDNHTDGCIPSS